MRDRGIVDVADIADRGLVASASANDAARARVATTRRDAATGLAPLTDMSIDAWHRLSERAIEPNGYYLPGWELAVNASAPGRTDTSALCACSDRQDASSLIGLLPVIPLLRAYGIPLPALVSGHPYGTLCTPLIDRDRSEDAAAGLIERARRAGMHALLLREVALDGPVMKAIGEVLRRDGLRPRVLQSHQRACLDATREAGELLHDALGTKKLKELRRQRHRLAEHGAVTFDVARSPDEVAAALETFLLLEASGWKGQRGTALEQNEGDATFIRRATVALAETGQCEVITLRAGATPIAAGIVLRHRDRAFYFKIGVDERFARFSPGVQLTLELTRHLCGDPAIKSADSTASPDHPMINPIWRGRLAIGDVLIPLSRRDPVVPLIHAALTTRLTALEMARRGVRTIRSWRGR
jgi:CelD/BcsL family acetyltransferase involved in cellulose biosynthesis